MITNPLDVAQNEMYQTSESGLGEEVVWAGLLSTLFGTWVRVIPCHSATGFFSTVGG